MMDQPDASSNDAPPSDDARRRILESAGLFAHDPASFPGLSLMMSPENGLDPSFVPVAYDTRHTTKEMVHCSICSQKQEHFDGAIVRLRDGNVGLVGNDCGRRHFFGEDGWSALRNRMRQAEDQAIYLARFGSAKEQISAILPMLDAWVGNLWLVQKVRGGFEANLPQLLNAVRRQGHSGTLYLERVVQVPFRRANGTMVMREETQRVPHCRVDAGWFFEGRDLSKTVAEQRIQLNAAVSHLRADAKPHNVAAVRKMILQCRRELEAVDVQVQRFKTLTGEVTISKIAEWGNSALTHKDTYRARGRRLERVRQGEVKGDLDFASVPAALFDHWTQVKVVWPKL